MITEKRITEIINKKLDGTALFLIDVKIKQGNHITVFIDSDTNVTIEDCAALSRYLEPLLNSELDNFQLDVSSAGVGQPLKLIRQYKKNTGKEMKVRTKDNRYLQGILSYADDEKICITPKHDKKKSEDTAEIFIKYMDIAEAKTIVSFK